MIGANIRHTPGGMMRFVPRAEGNVYSYQFKRALFAAADKILNPYAPAHVTTKPATVAKKTKGKQ
jgi:hypothetical protein